MKKILIVLAVVFACFLMGASQDNLMVMDGTVLTSTGDQGVTWSTGTTGISTLAVTDASSYIYVDTAKTLTWVPSANAAEPGKRYVSVWVIDQDENIPLDHSILYEQKMWFTDRTPDEIRAGIPLLLLVDKHNIYRETLKDKEGKPLKKVRLRDISIVIRNW